MTRMKIILNPVTDNGRGKLQQEKISSLIQSHDFVELALTERAGHARELAREAAAAGYDVVAAAGGDGTVHEVVNGIMAAERPVKLGVIPIGSGNDFAYANGIPLDVTQAVAALFSDQVKVVDLARVEDENGRFVIMDNNFGVGFDAMVVAQSEQISWAHGFLKYMAAVFKSLAFHYKPARLHILFDEEPVAQESLFLYVGIGPRGGGGFLLTPQASQDDGLLDSCLVNPVSRMTLISMLNRAIKGTHITHKDVAMRVNRQIIVSLDDLAPMYVDGEMFAYPEDGIRRVTITSLPQAIQLLAGSGG